MEEKGKTTADDQSEFSSMSKTKNEKKETTDDTDTSWYDGRYASSVYHTKIESSYLHFGVLPSPPVDNTLRYRNWSLDRSSSSMKK